MNTFAALPKRTTQQTRWCVARAAVVALTCLASRPQLAHAEHVVPPAVPANIRVRPGNRPFLVGHGVGTQNYICLPSGTGFKFTLFMPQATLFNDQDKQIITHYFSPNPFE